MASKKPKKEYKDDHWKGAPHLKKTFKFKVGLQDDGTYKRLTPKESVERGIKEIKALKKKDIAKKAGGLRATSTRPYKLYEQKLPLEPKKPKKRK